MARKKKIVSPEGTEMEVDEDEQSTEEKFGETAGSPKGYYVNCSPNTESLKTVAHNYVQVPSGWLVHADLIERGIEYMDKLPQFSKFQGTVAEFAKMNTVK